MRRNFCAPLLVVLAAALAGCLPAVSSWPDVAVNHAASHQGVLVKMTFDSRLSGYFIFAQEVYFLSPTDPPDDARPSFPVHHSQFYSAGRYGLNRFPSDLLLIPLKPGHYSGIEVTLWYTPTMTGQAGVPAQNLRVRAPDELGSFDVEPGKITVLGTILSKVKIGVSDAEGSSTADTGVPEKLEVIDEALSRPEAESRGWEGLLRVARAELVKR